MHSLLTTHRYARELAGHQFGGLKSLGRGFATARVVSYQGFKANQFKDVKECIRMLKEKFESQILLQKAYPQVEENRVNIYVCGEFGLGMGRKLEDDGAGEGGIVISWTAAGRYAVPVSWMMPIGHALQEVAIEMQKATNEQHLICFTAVYEVHDEEGQPIFGEDGHGRKGILARNTCLIARPDSISLVNKTESSSIDDMGQYVIASPVREDGSYYPPGSKPPTEIVTVSVPEPDGTTTALNIGFEICLNIATAKEHHLDPTRLTPDILICPGAGSPSFSQFITQASVVYVVDSLLGDNTSAYSKNEWPEKPGYKVLVREDPEEPSVFEYMVDAFSKFLARYNIINLEEQKTKKPYKPVHHQNKTITTETDNFFTVMAVTEILKDLDKKKLEKFVEELPDHPKDPDI